MQLTTELQHDEINLFRLVRRLEKSAQLSGISDVNEGEISSTAWVQCQKELQKVKYARKLVKNVESYERDSGSTENLRRLNAVKYALDKIESSLKDFQSHCTPSPRPTPSLLDQLPPPQDLAPTPSTSALSPPPSTHEGAEEDLADGQTTPKAHPQPLPLVEDNFLTAPSESYPGLSSSGLVSAIPALLSASDPYAEEDDPPAYRAVPAASATTALSSSSASGLFSRRPPPSTSEKPMEAHTALQTELQNQLAAMSAQLKRNALHFASALEADKAVVERAGEKVEGNLGFMEVQRVRLKEFAGKSRKSTWMTLAIVIVVLVVFMLMVGFIRATRFYN